MVFLIFILENSSMTVDTTLLKMCYKKRKDVTAPAMQLSGKGFLQKLF